MKSSKNATPLTKLHFRIEWKRTHVRLNISCRFIVRFVRGGIVTDENNNLWATVDETLSWRRKWLRFRHRDWETEIVVYIRFWSRRKNAKRFDSLKTEKFKRVFVDVAILLLIHKVRTSCASTYLILKQFFFSYFLLNFHYISFRKWNRWESHDENVFFLYIYT